jgi:hypothetical protein
MEWLATDDGHFRRKYAVNTSVICRFEVSTAVTMMNAVFCDIKIQFLPHRKHYVSAKELGR